MGKNNYHTNDINVKNSAKDILNFVVRNRYLLALITFLLLVVLKVNGSSLMCWERDIDLSGHDTVIFGVPNFAKSFEYKGIFPAFFSQQLSDSSFSTINYDITSGGQNMLAAFGAPIFNVYTLSKPCLWGFFFLPPDFALSFYWDLKMILMLILGFELSMILSRRDKLLSALGALWIALSPAVAWNFSDALGEVILYTMAIVVTFYYFCRYFYRRKLKILFAILFLLSVVGFLTPVNINLQIPFGILAFILVFLVSIDFKGKLHFMKKDAIIVGSAALVLVLMLVNFAFLVKGIDFLNSGNVYETETYPFLFLSNFFTPFFDIGVSNQSDLASFINFLPAVLLAAPIIFSKSQDRGRKFGVALGIYSIVFAALMLLGFNKNLNLIPQKFSMLAFSFASTLLSLWAISVFAHKGGLSYFYACAAALIVGIAYFFAVRFGFKGNVNISAWILVIVVFILLNFLLLLGKKNAFTFFMVFIILISGLTVNPLNVGAGAIMKAPLSQHIRKVDKLAKGARWLAIGSDSANVLIYANGAKALGGYNAYPDLSKWKLIDKTATFKTVYNRPAMITFNIEKGGTTGFTLTSKNSFYVTVTTRDLKSLGVDYIVSDKDLSEFDDDIATFKVLYPTEGKNYTIYSVNYAY